MSVCKNTAVNYLVISKTNVDTRVILFYARAFVEKVFLFLKPVCPNTKNKQTVSFFFKKVSKVLGVTKSGKSSEAAVNPTYSEAAVDPTYSEAAIDLTSYEATINVTCSEAVFLTC